jgi:hypothetical protein
VDLRCSLASRRHDEPLAGTASTVRAFLLVEHDGPWGIDALRDCRLPAEVCTALRRRSAATGVRTLLIRRPVRRRPAGEAVQVFAAWAEPGRSWLEGDTLPDVQSVLDLDLSALAAGRSTGLPVVEQPVFAVCTHGRHDACCAERGRPTMRALALSRPAESWEVSHIGGDRFAANLLVLPDGLYYGRVEPEEAGPLAAGHLAGRLDLDRFRGRSGFPFPAQAAEIALRRQLDETALDAVRLLGSSVDGAVVRVRLEARGREYAVDVRVTAQPETQLTCRSPGVRIAQRYDVVAVAAVG